MTGNPAIPDGEDGITADWLSQALNAGDVFDLPEMAGIRVERTGVGIGLLGDLLRCHLDYRDDAASAPDSVIVKLPGSNPTSRRIARKRSLYRREYEYYRRSAPQTPIRTPTLYYSDYDAGSQDFVLVMEDLGGLEMTDSFEGATAAQAKCAIRAAAALHGHYWNELRGSTLPGVYDSLDPRHRPAVQVLYLACLGPFLARFGNHFSGEMRRLAERYGTRVAAHLSDVAAGPRTFIHGDSRCDSIFFGGTGDDDIAAIDWQACGIGAGLYDVVYFLADSVTTETRRSIEREALVDYHDIVCRMGLKELSFEECWRDYRQTMLAGLLVPVIMGGTLDLAEERSQDLIETALKRRLAAIADLDAGEFLPRRPRIWSLAGALSALAGCTYTACKASRGLGRMAN